MASNLHFLAQFMSSQGPQFLLVISWILVLKNLCLVFLTILLKFSQSLTHFENQYLSSPLLHSSFHHILECLVILTIFKFLNQIFSVLSVNLYMIQLRSYLLVIWSVFSSLIAVIISAMNFSSSLLFLTIVYFLVWIYSSKIMISTVRGVWSDKSLYSGWIVWLLSSYEFSQRNMRLIIEFESSWLSEYLVGTWLVDLEIHKFIESVISIKRSLWAEWCRKEGFWLQYLMLKSLVITKILLILASISFRCHEMLWTWIIFIFFFFYFLTL